MIFILVLVALAVYIDLPNTPGFHIGSFNRDIKTHLGLDLVGGVQALLEADMPAGQQVDNDKMRAATRIVENRVNGLGVEEAVVQQAGENRIVVEIPGVKDPEQAIATIRETGLLEFVHMGSNPLPDGVVVQTDFGQAATPTEPTPGLATPTGAPVAQATPTTESPIYHTVMTGEVLKTVEVGTGTTGEYTIDFVLTPEGAKTFAEYTSTNIGQFLGIVLDKQVISAPRVESAITEGRGIISGSFTLESANVLAVQLRYGSLPIPLKVVESRTIGPTLGQDSLQKSLVAGIIGFSVVILFMAFYYRLPGLLADVAIIIYGLLTLALFRYIPVTLTLPGIAGLMLSTGSALDANILIFERLKEELRGGKTLPQAVDLAWQRAWPSIRDSNIATLITCAILFWFGSAFGATIVKGFSLTLALGVGVSLFTAIIITRTFLNLVLGYIQQIDHAKWFGI
ncbi:MAG TPA: protein translocase subunit SecD [Anaerolineales bacterium]|nr:protein translocase subunit SecD [Anaerolineales bacterium]